MPFASDSFSGTANDALQTYSANWAKQSGFTQDMSIGHDSPTYACDFSGNRAVYQHAASPNSADYSVFADLKRLATGTNQPVYGVAGRMQAGASTFYSALQVTAANQIRLYKCVGSTTFTQLASASNTQTVGVAQNIELRMVGTTISVYIDGTQVISVTDSSITSAGKAGLVGEAMRDTGLADLAAIDNWHADNPATPSDLGGNVTLDDVSVAGGFQSVSGVLGGAVGLADVAVAGTLGAQPGVCTVPGLKNDGASLQTSVTVANVVVLRVSDRAIVLALVNQVSNASTGDLVISDASLVPGTSYLIVGWNSDGSQSFRCQATAV
jgi:hypothetical protein